MQEIWASSSNWPRGPHRNLWEQVPKKRSDDSFHIDPLQAQKQAPRHACSSIAQRDNIRSSIKKLDGEFWRADLESTIDQDVQHWLCAPPCSPFAINGTSDSAGAQHGESAQAELDRKIGCVQIGACFEPGTQAAQSLAPGQSSVANWLVISNLRLSCTRHSDEAVSRASTDASSRVHAQAEFTGGHGEWSQLENLPHPRDSTHLRENRGTGIQVGQFLHNDNPLLVKRQLELLMNFGNSPVKERHKQRISAPPRHSEDLGLQKALEVASWAQRVNSSSSEPCVPVTLGRARVGAIVSAPRSGAKGY
jgi:hypothetical protein